MNTHWTNTMPSIMCLAGDWFLSLFVCLSYCVCAWCVIFSREWTDEADFARLFPGNSHTSCANTVRQTNTVPIRGCFGRGGCMGKSSGLRSQLNFSGENFLGPTTLKRDTKTKNPVFLFHEFQVLERATHCSIFFVSCKTKTENTIVVQSSDLWISPTNYFYLKS